MMMILFLLAIYSSSNSSHNKSGTSRPNTASPSSAMHMLLGRSPHITSSGCDFCVAAMPPRMVSDETWVVLGKLGMRYE